MATTKEANAHYKDLYRYGGNREVAILRDGSACVNCGITREKHRQKYGKDITVDHIDNMGTGLPKHERNNALNNLQTLCLRCHAQKDSRRRVAVVQSSLEGQEIKVWHSIFDAEQELGIKYQNISRACRGGRPTAGGYKWTYA